MPPRGPPKDGSDLYRAVDRLAAEVESGYDRNMRAALCWLLLSALPFGCTSSTDEIVDLGLTLKSEYQAAWCAVASDGACTSESCDFEAYESAERCDDAVNLAFTDCPGIYEAMGGQEASIRACISQLESIDCAGGEVCEGEIDLLVEGECQTIADLQEIWCGDYDTWR